MRGSSACGLKLLGDKGKGRGKGSLDAHFSFSKGSIGGLQFSTPKCSSKACFKKFQWKQGKILSQISSCPG